VTIKLSGNGLRPLLDIYLSTEVGQFVRLYWL